MRNEPVIEPVHVSRGGCSNCECEGEYSPYTDHWSWICGGYEDDETPFYPTQACLLIAALRVEIASLRTHIELSEMPANL